MDDQNKVQRFPFVGGAGPVYSKLYDLLKTTTKVVITDEDLAIASGESCCVGAKGYGTLGRVIKRVEKEGRVWEREAGAGCIRLLGDGEKVAASITRKTRAVRGIRRAAVVLSSVDGTKLTPEERPRANALLAQLGALSLMGSSTTTKKLETRKVEGIADVGAVMELIVGPKKIEAK